MKKKLIKDYLLVLFAYFVYAVSFLANHMSLYKERQIGLIIILAISGVVLFEALLNLDKDLKRKNAIVKVKEN